MKKITAILFAALAFAGAPAVAQQADPAVTAAARDLIEAMDMRKTTAEAFAQMSRSMPAMIRASAEQAIRANAKLSDAERAKQLAELDARVSRASGMVAQIYSDPTLVDAIVNEMVPLYARYYTVEDMKAMAAFYRTPAGMKTLKLMPQLMNEGMQIGQRIMQPRVQKALQEANKQ